MSRSRRKSPFCGFTTAESDKAWKQQSARQARRIAHQVIGQTLDGDAVPDRRAIGDCYGLKEGQRRLANPDPRDLRKSAVVSTRRMLPGRWSSGLSRLPIHWDPRV